MAASDDRRRQRAGLRGAACRCEVLLGPGPQDAARRTALPKLEAHHLPRQARQPGRAGAAASRRWPARSPRRHRRRRATRPSAPRGSAKADLVTGMVGEFPELQGVMGRYYAMQEGVDPDGRGRHPRPLQAAGPDRHVPDGAGLRRGGAGRQARHAGRLLRHRREADRLQGSVRAAPRGARHHPAHRSRTSCAAACARSPIDKCHRSTTALGVEVELRMRRPARFFADRLKVHLRERGAPRSDRRGVRARRRRTISSAWSRGSMRWRVPRQRRRRRTCSPAFGAPPTSSRSRRRRTGAATTARRPDCWCRARRRRWPRPSTAAEAQRQAGHRATRISRRRCAALAKLRAPVDAFFDKVTVNADDPSLRANRLRLLIADPRGHSARSPISAESRGRDGDGGMTKWVYRFGGGTAEGRRRDAQSARRQGRQSGRDGQSRPAGAAGLHHHHRGLHLFLRERQQPIRPI